MDIHYMNILIVVDAKYILRMMPVYDVIRANIDLALSR